MIDADRAGRTVLVTGGAAGLGAAISRAFSAQGTRLAVHHFGAESRPPEGSLWEHRSRAEAQVTALAGELGAVTFAADLTAAEAPRLLPDAVTERLGPVDVLVNNAAHCEQPDSIETLGLDGLARHYAVNTFAPALLTSTDAARAFPGQTGYGTSKAALEGFTRSAALDLGPSGIRVNAVAPGPVQTGWLDGEMLEHARSIVPLGRVGEPEDIADAVVLLASRQARWITGQVLQVAGGHALQAMSTVDGFICDKARPCRGSRPRCTGWTRPA
ncbi:SDR family NAD(P)-dependent oxidoreductase [Sciscionella marina]|uniref:SDR family NAD(P)-dependent oxidoreductase n=1 Tax=Sciscionella marina TaxID=508770 RepID=UPI000361729F|nr:SDR family oxidoreductase [Sciscionella marina]